MSSTQSTTGADASAPSIVVLISGSGSNLQAIIDACLQNKIDGHINAVISNKADAYGLVRAAQTNINTHVVSHKDFESRELYDQALVEVIDQYQPQVVVLAGFMRILTANFVEHYKGKLINIHPSLLPKYQGLNTHQRAIDAGDEEHGCSVHFVTEELDGGPVILQAKVPVFSDDDADDLAQRVHVQEHLIYPMVVKWMCEDRLKMATDGAYLDNERLPIQGYAFDD
ncbi:phosphoribosylglycinamide formyltransferase [Psychrosphaera sp. B3R10]|uniref:Phosphoribosylglycinamide formyltransferase n=1 Tax=Psychrosphaera algicola TaxID=3023714 RepID=A0ABT5FIA0_9GAMM|nr:MULTISPECIES: phosphoribosylglycinamide formyltransferase [unclassified Psychrosphaera]MBU2881640.1 phosphoribosylglycinamide formyltransferase [Psychrosphaera sp. I2R16]MBU2991105.1 phosphoribosylglycinamide formyltransferase [Psychrosphaera sp. B3R10]MDC2890922.1 phosphoribosylglycinamide formyltransferase [Psychrosphaera sp. G1-22]MDO6721458.1 phosphoribosylglycinamide formyltransferase [Psychrosphaera sp. 1_MG-2023]